MPQRHQPSTTTQLLIDMLTQRDALGLAKYGTTLDRTDLTPDQWLQHLTEELLDAAGYAQAMLRTLRGLECEPSQQPSGVDSLCSVARNKVAHVSDRGYVVNGVSVIHPETRHRGLIDNSGGVHWIPQQAAGVPDGWVLASERLPDSGMPVIAFVTNPNGFTRRIRAMYAVPRTLESNGDGDADGDCGDYDEASDTYWCPAGWYEKNEYEETNWSVNDPVTYWTELPPAPKPEVGS